MDPALRAAPTPLGLGLCLQDFSVRRRSRLGSLGSLGSLQGLEGLHFGWLHFRLSGTLGSGHLRGFQQLHGVIGFYVILGCRFLHLIHLIRLISFIHFLQLFLQGLTWINPIHQFTTRCSERTAKATEVWLKLKSLK